MGAHHAAARRRPARRDRGAARPSGRAGAVSCPAACSAAALTLGLLYALAVIQHPPGQPYLAGALFMLALGAFLFADRLSGAQAIPAAALLAARCRRRRSARAGARTATGPWLDFQHIADDIANAGTTTYDWNHSYGPLHWPRTGHTLLRINGAGPAYWKAEVLDTFDGREWRHAGVGGAVRARHRGQPEQPAVGPDRSRCTTSGLRSTDFVTAGETLQVRRAQTRPIGAGAGTFIARPRDAAPRRQLHRQRLHAAPVADAAGAGRHATTRASRASGCACSCPDIYGRRRTARLARLRGRGELRAVRDDRPGGARELPRRRHPPGRRDQLRAPLALRRIYALAQRLRARAPQPVRLRPAGAGPRAPRRRLHRDAAAQHANPLDAFLFDDHARLLPALLRRDGAAAAHGRDPRARGDRASAPASYDRRTGEYVVRDLDAHSWVEAYFPRLGWVTFDPTPAASPAARSRPRTGHRGRAAAQRRGRNAASAPTAPTPPARPRRRRRRDARARATVARRSSLALLLAAAAVGGAAPCGAAGAARARRRPELAELERALRRTRRAPPARGDAARARARRSAAPARHGYLDALARARYGAAAPRRRRPPQRRALRRELGAGLGAARRAARVVGAAAAARCGGAAWAEAVRAAVP